HLAGQYRRQGQWPLAAETMEALADRYPDHPLAGEALAWLVQYHAGAEAAWRVQGQQRTTTQALGRPATSTLSIDPSAEENRPAKAAEFARRIERTRPELFLDPAIRFPLSVADRRQGRPGEAEQYLMLQRRRADHDAWWSCAQGEAWLATRTGHSPKPVVRCRLSAVKPTLDGRLDEPCWKQAEEAVLVGRQPGDPARPAVLKLARDDQFLYLACRCEQEPGVNYANPAGPRPRDADLSGRDRVELFLDVDRDYASYYRLAFDHAGRTRDECWGDPSWNPTWFVAAASDAKTWTVEAAIPLEGLTGRFPRAGDVWALGVQRIVSGAGFQSWNTPAAPAVLPEGFGYLVFE
ncbi:MAG TPA: sugar-binding protein, partial [Thermoguttaceae bacterium]|nr:sugar-binding protein [Thermoguttaceae bacterium]